MKILGIDPGSRRTGFGIVQVRGDQAVLIESGVVKAGSGEFPERLGIIFSETLPHAIFPTTSPFHSPEVVRCRN